MAKIIKIYFILWKGVDIGEKRGNKNETQSVFLG